jgi:uncharacterized OB-fold protein
LSIDSFYEYPAGIALSKFLTGLTEEKLYGSRCWNVGTELYRRERFA